MRIAVTGANGFVGAHVVRALVPGHDVLAIDNLRYGPWRFTAEERSRFASDTTDLRDGPSVLALIDRFRPEAIIHLAAIHFIPECERLPEDAVTINVQGTVNLLAACPDGCRMVYASTAAVYAPSDVAHTESRSAIGPMDVYGFTKLHGEDFVRYFSAQKGIQSVIVRLFNVIGPGETNPHVLPEIIRQLKAGARRLALGNVHPKRDYIYVQDVAEGFIAAATQDLREAGSDGPIVANLGSGKSYSVKELVERLSDTIGDEISIGVDQGRVRLVDRPHLLADNTTMRTVFRWAPKYGIDDALRSIWLKPDFFDRSDEPGR